MKTKIFAILFATATLLQNVPAADIIWARQGRGGGDGVAGPGPGEGSLTWEDDEWRKLVESWGHNIIKFEGLDDLETLSDTAYESLLEEFEAADLVVMSRDSNSGDYNDELERETWTNAFSTPLLIMSPYMVRDSRWQMVVSSGITDAMNSMVAVKPEHPIFEGVELTDGSVEFWSQLGPEDHIDLVNETDFGFAEVIAVEAETEIPWIAYWDGESNDGDFYDGAFRFAGGPRLYLSAGSDDDPNTWGEKNITPAGDQIFINAITFLTGDAGTPPVTELPNDCNDDKVVDVADLDCILGAGGPEALESLLEELGILPGDLDGNGNVEFADFLVLSGNFGKDVTSYPEGDIDGNGKVEFADFLALSGNFGMSSGGAAVVPEPSAMWSILMGIVLTGLVRRWHR